MIPIPGLKSTASSIGSVAAGKRYGKTVLPGIINCMLKATTMNMMLMVNA
jgi:hypothetical protein